MKKFNWRRFLRSLHRDLGYFFTGAILMYAISGIAVNHYRDWNPSYVVEASTQTIKNIPESWNKQTSSDLLKELKIESSYRKHYAPDSEHIRIFHRNGSVTVNLETKEAYIENLKKRPVLHTLNKLHFNPGKLWTWYSDIFAGSLILITLSGLVIVKGKKGMRWRGTILVALGLIVPGIIATLSL